METTALFLECVERLRSSEAVVVVRPARPAVVPADASEQRRFMAAVALIGQGIHDTSLKLQEMTKRTRAWGVAAPVGAAACWNIFRGSVCDDLRCPWRCSGEAARHCGGPH
jgi:hypothetical protein